jgi:hypothetical protein
VVQRLSLAQWLVEVKELHHIDAVWLLQEEDFVDVLEHYLVVMSLAVKLAQV